jgi:hypothetical protein
MLMSVQNTIAAGGVRVLLHCTICLLVVTAMLMSDAALVAFLVLGQPHMPLAEALGIAVGFNMALGVALVVFVLVQRQRRLAAIARAQQERAEAAAAAAAAGGNGQKLDNFLAGFKGIKGAVGGLGGGMPGLAGSGSGGAAAGGGGALAGGVPGMLAAGSPFAQRLVGVWQAVGRVIGAPQGAAGQVPGPGEQGPWGEEGAPGGQQQLRHEGTSLVSLRHSGTQGWYGVESLPRSSCSLPSSARYSDALRNSSGGGSLPAGGAAQDAFAPAHQQHAQAQLFGQSPPRAPPREMLQQLQQQQQQYQAGKAARLAGHALAGSSVERMHQAYPQ